MCNWLKNKLFLLIYRDLEQVSKSNIFVLKSWDLEDKILWFLKSKNPTAVYNYSAVLHLFGYDDYTEKVDWLTHPNSIGYRYFGFSMIDHDIWRYKITDGQGTKAAEVHNHTITISQVGFYRIGELKEEYQSYKSRQIKGCLKNIVFFLPKLIWNMISFPFRKLRKINLKWLGTIFGAIVLSLAFFSNVSEPIDKWQNCPNPETWLICSIKDVVDNL